MRRADFHLADIDGLYAPLHEIGDFEIVSGRWLRYDDKEFKPDKVLPGYHLRVVDYDIGSLPPVWTFEERVEHNRMLLEMIMPELADRCLIAWSRYRGQGATEIVVIDRHFGVITDADALFLALVDHPVSPTYSINRICGEPSRGVLCEGVVSISPFSDSTNFCSGSVLKKDHPFGDLHVHELRFDLPVEISDGRRNFVYRTDIDEAVKRDLFGEMRPDIFMFRTMNEFRFVSRFPFSEDDLSVFRSAGVVI